MTPVPNIGEAPNGDHAAILVTQPFFFSVHPKSVTGGGTFTHTFPGGSFSTTWTATELLSFQPYGCGLAPTGATLPANFCGGRVEMRISIATPFGPVDATLTVYCLISDDGQRPTNAEEGIRLLIPGVINFNKSEGWSEPLREAALALQKHDLEEAPPAKAALPVAESTEPYANRLKGIHQCRGSDVLGSWTRKRAL